MWEQIVFGFLFGLGFMFASLIFGLFFLIIAAITGTAGLKS